MRRFQLSLRSVITSGLVTAVIVGLVAANVLDGSASSTKSQIQSKAARLRKTQQFRNETSREWVRKQAFIDPGSAPQLAGSSRLSETRSSQHRVSASSAPPPPSPGQDIGKTSFDFQTLGSLGHRVARKGGDGANLHFTWQSLDFNPSQSVYANARVIRYARYSDPENYPNMDPDSGSGYNGIQLTGEGDRAGYPDIDVDSLNHAQIGYYMNCCQHFNTYAPWHIQFPFGEETFQIYSLTGHDNSCPQIGYGTGTGGVLWPRLTADRADITLHEIAHSNVNDCIDHKLWYWRFDGITTWSGPGLIDNSEDITYALAVDANSDKVAVVVHAQSDGLTNVHYLESQLNGSDWLTSSSPLPRTAITNYTDPNGPQAWLHLTATYDNSIPGALHVMWDEQRHDATGQAAIKHWNSSRGTIRTAALAYWDNPASNGLSNLNFSKLSMGIGDGSTMCQNGAESNNNYVYCIYTQFGGVTPEELADHSHDAENGYMNGELYLVASNTGGNTWSAPQNLTNTKTPGCNPGLTDVNEEPEFPESVCRSEHWASINRVVRDIDISFISDRDAGAVVYFEGSWQMNRVMYLQLPGGTADAPFVCPLTAPVFEALISSNPICEYNAPTFGHDEAVLTVINLGNDDLEGVISVTDFPGAPTLAVADAGAYSVAGGASDLVTTVTMSANFAAEGLYSGEVLVTHNDTSKPSPRVYPIDFFVFDQFYCPEVTPSVVTGALGPTGPGSLKLHVSNNGRFGSRTFEGGLWRYSDSSSSLYEGSLLIAHGTQGPDTTVFLNFYDRESNGQHGFRPQSELDVDISAQGTGQGCATVSAKLCTADSVVGISVDWIYPQSSALDEFILGRFKFYRHNPSVAVENLALGLIADFDIIPAPWASEFQVGNTNSFGYDLNRNLVYQRGTDSIFVVDWPIAGRFRAGIVAPGGFAGAFIGNSADDLEPQGGPSDGRLYQLLTQVSGIEAFGTEETDLYTLVALDRGLSIDVGETLYYTIAFVSDTAAAARILEIADSAIANAATLCLPCYCPCKHDPQCDGTISDVLDVVAAIGVAFRNDPESSVGNCPRTQYDVDASGVTDVADVVKVINVAFRNQTEAANYVEPCI